MSFAIVTTLRRTANALLASRSSSELAAGSTLGMVLGLVPKGNLIALSLFVLIFSLRCSKGLALLAALLFTCLAPWTDPVAHRLGLAVLSIPSMQVNYASMFTLPLGPWWGFHNTVVTGSLLIGMYAAYPVYWLMEFLFSFAVRGDKQ